MKKKKKNWLLKCILKTHLGSFVNMEHCLINLFFLKSPWGQINSTDLMHPSPWNNVLYHHDVGKTISKNLRLSELMSGGSVYPCSIKNAALLAYFSLGFQPKRLVESFNPCAECGPSYLESVSLYMRIPRISSPLRGCCRLAESCVN